MSIHHSTIKKYTAALLDVFNGLEVEYADSLGVVRTKNIPVKYASREKSRMLDEHTLEQLQSKNYNVLPRASLTLSTLIRTTERTTNQSVKLNTVKTDTHFEYMYNAVPYTFTFELAVMCRGMNEATMVIEQVVPLFNPIYYIDIYEVPNLDEPTRIPLSLLDISMETSEYDEFSQNIVTVNFGLELKGNIYPPIKIFDRVKEFKMYINEYGQPEDNYFTRKSIYGWDVNNDGTLINETSITLDGSTQYAPEIIDIVGNNIIVGVNSLEVIYQDLDNKDSELTFEWVVLSGDATISGDNYSSMLTINAPGDVEVEVKITDIHGNFNSFSKIFTAL